MPLPADMQDVGTAIEKHFVSALDEFARSRRISRSRAVRDLVIEGLERHFILPASSPEETRKCYKEQVTDKAAA